MTLLFRLIIFIILIISSPMLTMAKGIKYNHNSETISEIKKKVDFTILTPRKIPDDWTLDTKTSPWIMLNYMDSKDAKLMVSITLRRGFPLSDEDFPHSQKVNINGNTGYYQDWIDRGNVERNGDKITGGILHWTQNGTFVIMTSYIFSKDKMLEIARSMK